MIKTFNRSIFVFLLIILSGCDKSDETVIINSNGFSEALLGNWSNREFNDGAYTFERVESLPFDNYGISFKHYNIIVERKNSGWCGTPPIAYDNFKGSWTQNDSIINLEVEFWGGNVSKVCKMILLNNNYLSVETIE